MKEFYPTEKNKTPNINIHVETHVAPLITYLNSNTKLFNIVYFEHPYISSLHQAYNAMDSFSHPMNPDAMITSAIPKLANHLVSGAIVMATCSTPEEHCQMERILRYGLHLNTQSFSNRSQLLYLIPYGYSQSIAGNYNPILFAGKQSVAEVSDAKSKQIKRGQKDLLIASLLSIMLYMSSMDTGFVNNTLILLLLAAQFASHKPDNRSVKVAICATQSLLFLSGHAAQAATHSLSK